MSYDTITVGANQTFSKTLSNGETWENVLIDISASGADYNIYCSVSEDTTIRNIGVIGHFPDASGNVDPFFIRAATPTTTVTVENVAFEVTTEAKTQDPSAHHGSTGVYVHHDSEGTVEFDRVYFQNFPDNGFYCADPGNPNLAQGGSEIHISNSMAVDCNTSGFRLGSDGSTLDNCVAVGSAHRGFWAQYGDTSATNVDLVNNSTDLALGDGSTGTAGDTQVTMNDSRWESQTAHGSHSENYIHGTSVGTPQERIPAGCPTTAVQAASGEGDSPAQPSMPTFDHAITASGADGGHLMWRDDMGLSEGGTYEGRIAFESASSSDVGLAIVEPTTTGWGDFTGYLAFFHTGGNDIRVDRWSSGSQVSAEATSISLPTHQRLTFEIDFRDSSSSDIAFTVFDRDGDEVASVALADTTHDAGYFGVYRHHANGSWLLDRVLAETVPEIFVVETLQPTQITATSAVLHGYVDAMSASSASVRFEWREDGESEWTQTPSQTIASETGFEHTLTGLDSAVTYEFRAVGVDSTGKTDSGNAKMFTTRFDGDLVDDDFTHGTLDAYRGQKHHFTVTGGN